MSSLLLVPLLVCGLMSLVAGQSGVLRKMADAPWSERAESSAYHNTLPQSVLSASTGARILVPAGSIWVYGGLDSVKTGLSDVWVTTDSAKTWHEVSGISPDMTVQDASRSADCYDHRTGRVYAITGSDMESKKRGARIVASYDGQHWEIINHDAGFPVRERPGCTVDSQGWVYMFGGSTFNAQTNANGPSNDVWVSKDLGYTFTRQTLRAPWYMRVSPDAQTFHSAHLGVDVIYVANGDGGTGRFQNDLWVSSDSTRTWSKVATARYAYRKDSELTITRDGILIVASGDDDESNVNDLWASMDGGFTCPPLLTPPQHIASPTSSASSHVPPLCAAAVCRGRVLHPMRIRAARGPDGHPGHAGLLLPHGR